MGLCCQLCYKKLRVLHISEGIWGGDARSLVSSPGLQGENATQRAQPYQDCQQQKLQVLKKGEATRGHKIVVNWVILCRRKGIRAANPPRLCPRRREPSPTHLFLSYCHCGEGGDLLFVGRGGPRVFQLAQELQRQHQMYSGGRLLPPPPLYRGARRGEEPPKGSGEPRGAALGWPRRTKPRSHWGFASPGA